MLFSGYQPTYQPQMADQAGRGSVPYGQGPGPVYTPTQGNDYMTQAYAGLGGSWGVGPGAPSTQNGFNGGVGSNPMAASSGMNPFMVSSPSALAYNANPNVTTPWTNIGGVNTHPLTGQNFTNATNYLTSGNAAAQNNNNDNILSPIFQGGNMNPLNQGMPVAGLFGGGNNNNPLTAFSNVTSSILGGGAGKTQNVGGDAWTAFQNGTGNYQWNNPMQGLQDTIQNSGAADPRYASGNQIGMSPLGAQGAIMGMTQQQLQSINPYAMQNAFSQAAQQGANAYANTNFGYQNGVTNQSQYNSGLNAAYNDYIGKMNAGHNF